jgi:hypothetical protein
VALDTYTNLSTAIGTWGTRTYASAQTDEFILIAEDRINSRLGAQYRRETTGTITTNSSGEATLPADFIAMRSIVRDYTGAEPLIPVSWRTLIQINPSATSGLPQNYAIQGSTLKVAPVCEDDFNAVYWAKLTALGSNNATNWLLTLKPSVYLFYCRAAQAAFEEEEARAAVFMQMGDDALDDLVAQGTVAQYAAAEMVLDQVTP